MLDQPIGEIAGEAELYAARIELWHNLNDVEDPDIG